MNEKNELYYFLIENYKFLCEIVFEKFRDMIVNGDLKFGERFMEIKFVEMFGVLRIFIREVIRKFEFEGFVVMFFWKGVYVVDIFKKEIMDVLEIWVVFDKFVIGFVVQ